jgi:hypothetical protein
MKNNDIVAYRFRSRYKRYGRKKKRYTVATSNYTEFIISIILRILYTDMYRPKETVYRFCWCGSEFMILRISNYCIH